MTTLDEIEKEPWRFDFFDTLRRIERQFGRTGEPTQDARNVGRPRIGDASARREEYVSLGQNPYFEFPASNLSVLARQQGRYRILVRFLGLLGPTGALPLATTEESYAWLLRRDEAFPRFLDLINHRFLQLFFRAWADARPAAQHDRPDLDRFVVYLGSTIGIGSPHFLHLDSVADTGKLAYSGLLGSKAKSASRLEGALRGILNVEAEVEEFVGLRLELEPTDRTLLGGGLSRLGVDTMIGATFYSIQDKIRIRIFVPSLDEYKRFLPHGDRCEPLVDLVFLMLGEELDWDVELSIPAAEAAPARLDGTTQLGWTTWLSPDPHSPERRSDARLHAAERIRQKRERATTRAA